MGNTIQPVQRLHNCKLCNTDIADIEYVKCEICDVYFHRKCYGNHINKRGIYNKHARYTECPMSNCQRVGVISTYIIEIPNAKAVIIPKRKPIDSEIIL